MIIAGRLIKLLEFSEVIKTKNEYSETEQTLRPLFRTRAEPIQSETSRTITSDGGDVSKIYNFRLHYKKRIVNGLVITIDGQNLQITDIDNVRGENREIIIDAINYIQD